MTTTPTVVPVADHAVLVGFGGEINGETLSRIHAVDTALTLSPPVGLTEIVPAMTTLLIAFDPMLTDHTAISAAVFDSLAFHTDTTLGTRHVIDVCYDGEHAPDMSVAAERCGLTAAEVVDAHLAAAFSVGMYGFAPGYAYLYGTPALIRLPRNPTPGPVVPAGSVIIAGQQCLIIPVAMSTGWFAIGRTATEMLTADPDRPFLFDVGDTVNFRRIDAIELNRQLSEIPANP